MAFSLSGIIITQSGTDTSWDGLNGIGGVTRIANGDGYLYICEGLIVDITGTLTIANQSFSTLICGRLRVRSGGIYNGGSFAADGITPVSNNSHFMAVAGSSGNFDADSASDSLTASGSFYVYSGGTVTLIGGGYHVQGPQGFQNTSSITLRKMTMQCGRAYGVSSSRVRSSTTSLVLDSVRTADIGFDFFRIPSTTSSISSVGSEYIVQYIGSSFGGTDAKLTLSALLNPSGTYDFDNYGSGWIEIYDCASGAALLVVCQASSATHCVPLFQNIILRVTDPSGVGLPNVNYRCVDAPVSGSPGATITTASSLKTWDFRNPITLSGATDGSGIASFAPVLKVWWGVSNTQNLRFPSSTATITTRAYAAVGQSVNVILGVNAPIATPVAMPTISMAISQAAAAALTGISLVPSGATGGTVTVSSSHTIAEVWAYYRNFIFQIVNFDRNDTWTYDNATGYLDIGAWSIVTTGASTVLSGNRLTTSSTSTLAAGGTYSPALIVVDSTGTSVPLSVTGVRNGTKVRVIRTDTSAELSIGLAGASGFTSRVTWTSDIPIKANTVYVNGLDAEAQSSSLGTLTNTGASITIIQTPANIYETNAVDGSIVTGITLDSPNIEIDADEVDNSLSVQEIYAWYLYTLMSDSGMRSFFGGIEPINSSHYEVDVIMADIKIHNIDTANTLMLTGGIIVRSDGTSIRKGGSTATYGSIEMVPEDVYVIETATSGLTAPESAQLFSLETVTIKAKTDNLPSDPADQSLLSAAIAAIPSAPTASVVASQVRTELATELARIDVTTSTRATPANITTSQTAIITEINANETKIDAIDIIVDDIKTKADLIPALL